MPGVVGIQPVHDGYRWKPLNLSYNLSQFLLPSSPGYGDLGDLGENREDESTRAWGAWGAWGEESSLQDLLRRSRTRVEPKEEEEGLSPDTLAFTLVYASVLSATILYIAIRLARRWRARLRGSSPSSPTPLTSPTSPSMVALPPCGHPGCRRVVQGALLVGGGGGHLVGVGPPPHSSATCRGRCPACSQLARPPPAYKQLFPGEEEEPPTYTECLAAMGQVQALEGTPNTEDRVDMEDTEDTANIVEDHSINMEQELDDSDPARVIEEANMLVEEEEEGAEEGEDAQSQAFL